MIPFNDYDGFVEKCVPRMCGDDPPEQIPGPDLTMCSPHVRG